MIAGGQLFALRTMPPKEINLHVNGIGRSELARVHGSWVGGRNTLLEDGGPCLSALRQGPGCCSRLNKVRSDAGQPSCLRNRRDTADQQRWIFG